MQLRIYKLAGLVAATISLMGGTAKAAAPTPELEADYAAALVWWGITPPQCGSVEIQVLPTDPAGELLAARASEPTIGQFIPICTISIFEDQWQEKSACVKEMMFRHEVGHLLGFGHSTDPTSIMAPTVSTEIWCEGRSPNAEDEANLLRAIVRSRVALGKLTARCPNLPTLKRRRECRRLVAFWQQELRELVAAL